MIPLTPSVSSDAASASVLTSSSISNRPELVCDTTNQLLQESLQHEWDILDRMLQQNYSDAKVSGGIFLYPRQTAILSHLLCQMKNEMKSQQKELTICETGFGSGHSMALFQTAAKVCSMHSNGNGKHPNVRILSFDKFDRPYQLPLWQHLNQSNVEDFRHRHITGNSCKTVPQTLSAGNVQCDILHGSSLCPTDNIDLVEHSPCGTILTSTAMDDLADRAVYFGSRAQWRKLRHRGCITPPICYQEDTLQTLHHDYVFAKKGSNITGKFCIAITTGYCSQQQLQGMQNEGNIEEQCSSIVRNIASMLTLERICPTYQIPVPS